MPKKRGEDVNFRRVWLFVVAKSLVSNSHTNKIRKFFFLTRFLDQKEANSSLQISTSYLSQTPSPSRSTVTGMGGDIIAVVCCLRRFPCCGSPSWNFGIPVLVRQFGRELFRLGTAATESYVEHGLLHAKDHSPNRKAHRDNLKIIQGLRTELLNVKKKPEREGSVTATTRMVQEVVIT